MVLQLHDNLQSFHLNCYMWQPSRKAVYLCSTVEEKPFAGVVGAWTLVWKWCPHSLITCNHFTWTVKCGSPLGMQSTCVTLLKKSSPLVLLEPELWYENGALTPSNLQSFHLNFFMWQPFRKAVYLCSTVEEKLSSDVVGAWALVWKWSPHSLIACNRFTWTVKCGSSAEKESILVQHCWRKALRWCCCWSLSFGMKIVFHLNCSLRQICRKAVTCAALLKKSSPLVL